jgi:hypothetical protein
MGNGKFYEIPPPEGYGKAFRQMKLIILYLP